MKTKTFFLAIGLLFAVSGCSAQSDYRLEHFANNLEENMEQLGDMLEDLGDSIEEWADSVEEWAVKTQNDSITFMRRNGNEIITYYGGNPKKVNSNIVITKNDKMILRKFPVKEFDALKVGYNFRVVMCDTVDSIVVNVSEKLNKYLNVRYNKGALNIGLNHINSIQFEDAICGYVYIPYNLKLKSVELNGSSHFNTKLPINVKQFNIELNGASRFEAQSIKAGTIDIDVSGSSHCKSTINGGITHISLSGASVLEGNINAQKLDIDLSGSSKQRSKVTANTIEIDLNGASGLTISGTAKDMVAHVSGSSKLSAWKLATANVNGTLSGAGSAEIKCSDRIVMDVSGASKLTYNGDVKNDLVSKTRTASITKK